MFACTVLENSKLNGFKQSDILFFYVSSNAQCYSYRIHVKIITSKDEENGYYWTQLRE